MNNEIIREIHSLRSRITELEKSNMEMKNEIKKLKDEKITIGQMIKLNS